MIQPPFEVNASLYRLSLWPRQLFEVDLQTLPLITAVLQRAIEIGDARNLRESLWFRPVVTSPKGKQSPKCCGLHAQSGYHCIRTALQIEGRMKVRIRTTGQDGSAASPSGLEHREGVAPGGRMGVEPDHEGANPRNSNIEGRRVHTKR